MKCPNCGAEVTGDVCEYCGSKITKPSKDGCPHCGSANIRYIRERRSRNLTETVAICQDCGNNWVSGNNALFEMKPNMLFMIIGLFVCFPVPVTILLWKADSVPQKLKYVLIALVWILYVSPFILPWIDFLLF